MLKKLLIDQIIKRQYLYEFIKHRKLKRILNQSFFGFDGDNQSIGFLFQIGHPGTITLNINKIIWFYNYNEKTAT